VTPDDLRARLAFDAMGLGSRARLRVRGWRGNDRLDPGFRAVTTVVRVPVPVGERIEAALERIRSRWPGHRYYPPASMHVTVLNLDPYVAAGGVHDVATAAGSVLAGHRRFRITLRGLNVSPWTVFAEAHGADAPVGALRSSLRRALQEQAGAPRRDSRLRRALPLVLANVVRFEGPVDPSLLRALQPWRAHTFGPFEVREIEIVRTDGAMSAENTELLATATLRP
jgi:2'-5' RNA ligase